MNGVASVLCLAEHDDDGLVEATRRALTLARELARSSGGRLDAVLVGPINDATREALADFAVARAYVVVLADVSTYAPVAWARALLEIVKSTSARVLVGAGSERGNEVFAHAGALAGRPFVANCLSARMSEATTMSLSRQRWAGSLIEESELDATNLVLLSVAFDGVVAEKSAPPREVEEVEVPLTVEDGDVGVRVSSWTARQGGVDLAGARVVVGGGRGVGNAENFAALDELAELLGAAVGVSRVVTSNGWRSHAQQVGQTGTRISPDLYLAAGISGATQHLAGCQSAKVMIAINTDPDAPIIARADYAVIGDLNAIVPALVQAIRAR